MGIFWINYIYRTIFSRGGGLWCWSSQTKDSPPPLSCLQLSEHTIIIVFTIGTASLWWRCCCTWFPWCFLSTSVCTHRLTALLTNSVRLPFQPSCYSVLQWILFVSAYRIHLQYTIPCPLQSLCLALCLVWACTAVHIEQCLIMVV